MVIRDSVHESNTVAQSTLPASLNIGNYFFSPIAGLRMDIGPDSTNVFFPTLWLIPAADITFILAILFFESIFPLKDSYDNT